MAAGREAAEAKAREEMGEELDAAIDLAEARGEQVAALEADVREAVLAATSLKSGGGGTSNGLLQRALEASEAALDVARQNELADVDEVGELEAELENALAENEALHAARQREAARRRHADAV